MRKLFVFRFRQWGLSLRSPQRRTTALANAESDPRRIEIDPSNPNRIWWSGNLSGRLGYIELLK